MSSVSATALIAGRYRLDRRVATDRTGEVWQGTDIELARPVAVKLLHVDAGDADAVGAFRNAACRAASLTHEGLVRVFDYWEPEPSDSARPFLVMEYVDGQSLASRLRAGPLGQASAVAIVAQVSAALEAAHRAGLAHGDIRPEKILLSSDGVAKLFGFSGTCPAGSAAIDADLRALGILTRECLTAHISPGGSDALPGQRPASVAELAALCAHESSDQPDAAAAIASRAAESREQPGQSANTEPWPAPSARQKSAKRGRAVAVRTSAVIAVALAAVLVFGAFKPTGGDPQAARANNAASVRVTAARLIGRPVHVVRLRLQRLGLVVRIRWQNSDSVTAGNVMAVRPAGLVPLHSTVVVVGSTGRSASGAAPGRSGARSAHRHRHTPRVPSHGPASGSPTQAPSPSPSSSPTPSPSPTNSPSPSGSPPPPSSPPPSSAPPPAGPAAG